MGYAQKHQQAGQTLSATAAQSFAAERDPVDAEDLRAESIGMASPGFGHSFSRIPLDPPPIQRKAAKGCPYEELEPEGEQTVQAKRGPAVDDGAVDHVQAAVEAAGRNGMPLPGEVRSYFEPRFGTISAESAYTRTPPLPAARASAGPGLYRWARHGIRGWRICARTSRRPAAPGPRTNPRGAAGADIRSRSRFRVSPSLTRTPAKKTALQSSSQGR